ncbi:MAG: deoxyribose-phosphate aldolase [bacterium]
MKGINKYIDQTNINKTAKAGDIKKTCAEARTYNFRGVCVNPEWIKLTATELKGTGINVICLIDPPIGDSPYRNRLTWCKKAKKDGATELDIVVNVVDVKHERWDKILKELGPLCKILPVKIIIGSGYLIDEEIAKVSQIAKKAGAICVKLATAKDPLENREVLEKTYHLKIMRKNAPGLLIKASGNIKTLADLEMVRKAGADIVGTSSGVKMVDEWSKKNKEK